MAAKKHQSTGHNQLIIGEPKPKHARAERMAIYNPENNDLITDGKQILATTLKYNVGY